MNHLGLDQYGFPLSIICGQSVKEKLAIDEINQPFTSANVETLQIRQPALPRAFPTKSKTLQKKPKSVLFWLITTIGSDLLETTNAMSNSTSNGLRTKKY
jgi:hypothetical protein